MTGEVLYRMFGKFMLDQNCGIDPWTELDKVDQTAWNNLAAWIVETGD